MVIAPLSPIRANSLLNEGATLIDIREADEHARESIPGAVNKPLSKISDQALPAGPLIFYCRSGMRTNASAKVLAGMVLNAPCYFLDGGIENWRKSGFATVRDRRQPIEIMRQVQMVAGVLVLLGICLSWAVNPAFLALTAFVGSGLVVAGVTGWCGMARLLSLLPWNRKSS